MKNLLPIIVLLTLIISCKKTEKTLQSITKVGIWTIDSTYNKNPNNWNTVPRYTINITGLTVSDSIVQQVSGNTVGDDKIYNLSSSTDTIYCSYFNGVVSDTTRYIFLQPLNNSFQQIRVEQLNNGTYQNILYQIFNCHK